jgi:putative endonuclease
VKRPRDQAARRRRAYGLGHRAEWAARVALAAKGYRVLARRYNAPGGEIDLIARRGDTVVFVEVKARPTLDEAMIAILPSKVRRISIAARHWLARNPWAMRSALRGDAVFVSRWRWPRHVVQAFDLRLD